MNMMLLLHELVLNYWTSGRKTRSSAKGWSIGNAACCHHRGHSQDTRARGNVLMSLDGTIVTNCYNCGFKAVYYGGTIGKYFERWLYYLGIPKEKIQEAKIEILKKLLDGEIEDHVDARIAKMERFKEVDLPENSRPVESWIESGEISADLTDCIDYLASRGRSIFKDWTYFWTPSKTHHLNKRIIIPFYYEGNIVGWTARFAGTPVKESKIPRYFNSKLSDGYLFNIDTIYKSKRKYILITEGPFDAIAVDGVAVLGSEMNKNQILWLNSVEQEKIIVPDRQIKNQQLIDVALANNWSVSFPEWEGDVKDAAKASELYGKLYTISSLINAKTASPLQIKVKRQLLKG